MNEFLTAIGLVLVIEGLLYASVPSMARRMAMQVSKVPDSTLRNIGIVVMGVGVGIVWLIRS